MVEIVCPVVCSNCKSTSVATEAVTIKVPAVRVKFCEVRLVAFCVIVPVAPPVPLKVATPELAPAPMLNTYVPAVTVMVLLFPEVSEAEEVGIRFSTLRAPSNLASPDFTFLINPSKSVTVAVVARVKVGSPVPDFNIREFIKGARKSP